LAAAGLKSLTHAREKWNLAAFAAARRTPPEPLQGACHIVRKREDVAGTRPAYATRPARCRPRAGRSFMLAGNVIRSSTGHRLQLLPRAVSGHVDRSTVDGRTVTISGWAANVERGRLADAVLIFSNDRFVGAVTTTMRRPDVSRTFHRQLTRSGYVVYLPRRLAEPGGEPANLRLFAVDGDLASPITFDCDRRERQFGCTG
jgi:hypothetical protein